MGELINEASRAFAEHGWLGLAGVLLTGVVGLYKLEPLQSILPEKIRWQSLAPLARALLVFVFAFLGFGLLAYAKTASVAMAIGAAIQAGLVAMGGKAVIDAAKAPVPPQSLPPLPVAARDSSSIRTKIPLMGNL